jgi:glycosyltransferase involved in cell wall biosynthesis
MKVSIVLRVKNEGKTLDKVLTSVKEQEFKGELEIVIVDSGSTDNSLNIARSHGCRIVKIAPEDFSWGYALNLGAQKAEGDFIIYLSGHCVPVNNKWLEELLRPFDDPLVGGVYSRNVPIPGVDPFEAVELVYFWFSPGELTPVEADSFSNAACALRKKCWDKVKFDEILLFCEDGEWAMRAKNAGWQIIYNPASCVYHSHPVKVETIYKRWFCRCYAAKEIQSFTRDGSPLYLVYKTFQYSFFDLKYLIKNKSILQFWKIPFYEAIRQIGGYLGARAAMKGIKFKKWNDVKIPGFIKSLGPFIE